jgi:hypothetical protein
MGEIPLVKLVRIFVSMENCLEYVAVQHSEFLRSAVQCSAVLSGRNV